ncbi:AMP binding protein [Mycena albidolilacea]|uniref:AMP binding protein n=1 Tax=Mycena albidolilacea TaxID=1033008 RepID=A0AAD7AIP9_9AGAR|nr:AMP binding protein [Mycena albidolilacea]
MAPRVYTSHLPDVPPNNVSIFTKLFSSRTPGGSDVGGHPGSWTAYVDAASGASLTRADVKKLALSFAYGLRDHPTTKPFACRGDTVLIFSPNTLAWPVVLYGSVAAGLRCTLANSAYTGHELAFQYKDSRAKLVLTAEEGISTVRAMFADIGLSNAEADKRILVLGSDLRWAGGPAATSRPEAAGLLSLEELFSRGTLKKEETFEGAAVHETVYLCYSSGTTGNPKGVETTHKNITTLVDIIVGFPLPSGGPPILGILPFYHIYGVSNLLHHPMLIGVPVVIQTRFEPVQFCANIARYKIAFAFIVPPVLVVLARHPAVDSYDLTSLEYMLSGAAPLGSDLVKMVQKRLLSKRKPGSTCLITQGYGLTETSPSTHMLDFASADRKVGSVGFLLPSLKARLVEDDDGDAEEGKPGELWIHGETVMKGYLNNPAATKNAITPDGWFKTGDVAIRDKEGYYYIVDRKKELIKYKGFQVPPAELEAILLTHPDIADAAVIGVDSVEQATELPRAYVVHANSAKIKTAQAKAAFADSVAKWIETKVAKHKYLRGGVGVIDIIPKSASGKILRRELRDQAKQEVARGEITTAFKARL